MGNINWKFTVTKEDRLDRCLRELELPGTEWISRAGWEVIVGNGWVKIDERVVKKAGLTILANQILSISLPALGLQASQEPAHCLYLDPNKNFGVFNKPVARDTYPLFPWQQECFANDIVAWLENQKIGDSKVFQNLADAPILEGGFVQRLDRDTSGAIVVAFNRNFKKQFREQFQKHLFKKNYLAICQGAIPKNGSYSLFYGTTGKTVKCSRTEFKGCEPAQLNLEILHQNAESGLIKISTNHGMRHVIRAGMSALDCPLVGDIAYGGNAAIANFHQLHALDVECLPIGLPKIQAPLSKTFIETLTNMGLKYPNET